MFAYCNNNPIVFADTTGNARVLCTERFDDGGTNAPNMEYLMAFYGVSSPSEVPDLPENAMVFVENIVSASSSFGFYIVKGKTVVFDAEKYSEYVFIGVGWGISKSMPLDKVVSQGYVYGIKILRTIVDCLWVHLPICFHRCMAGHMHRQRFMPKSQVGWVLHRR